VNAEAAWQALEPFDEKWGAKYPMIADSWRARWENITPFLAFPAELRKTVYTTNSIPASHTETRTASHPRDIA
jgi:putative transposase